MAAVPEANGGILRSPRFTSRHCDLPHIGHCVGEPELSSRRLPEGKTGGERE